MNNEGDIVTTLTESLSGIATETRIAAQGLAQQTSTAKNQALEAIALALEAATPDILAANQEDCELAQANGIPSALYARLKLNAVKLSAAIAGVRSVGELPDPVGTVQLKRELDDGLILQRVSSPLGVLGVIFEARPDAVMQIASLAIKSGNGVILKGGQEARLSCQALVNAIHTGLSQTSISPKAVSLLASREETRELLRMENDVNLIIPRGSNSFVRFIQDNTRIPVLGHADGICHLYIDRSADVNQAIAIAVDSKIQYPAACNAIETLLVDQQIAAEVLPKLHQAFQSVGVVLKGDAQTQALIPIEAASENDWSTEYSDLILAIKIVRDVDEAITHINTYGSGHTDGIVTDNANTAEQFMAQVDAAGVFHNCSTRFADGFRYGFGAEVGISTQRMPPRGPVGLEGLVTYKYQLVGHGHIVATYSGDGAKPFTHRDIPIS